MARIRNTPIVRRPPSPPSSHGSSEVTVQHYSIQQPTSNKRPNAKKTCPPVVGTKKTGLSEPRRSAHVRVTTPIRVSDTTPEEVTWIINKGKKEPTAVYKGYVYDFHEITKAGEAAYRCKFRLREKDSQRVRVKPCPGKIYIHVDNLNVTKAVQHSHAPGGAAPKRVSKKVTIRRTDDSEAQDEEQSPDIVTEKEVVDAHYVMPERNPVSLPGGAIYTSPRIVDCIPTIEEVRNAVSEDDEDYLASPSASQRTPRVKRAKQFFDDDTSVSSRNSSPRKLDSFQPSTPRRSRPRTRSSDCDQQTRALSGSNTDTTTSAALSVKPVTPPPVLPKRKVVTVTEVKKRRKDGAVDRRSTLQNLKKLKNAQNLRILHAETTRLLSPPHSSTSDVSPNPLIITSPAYVRMEEDAISASPYRREGSIGIGSDRQVEDLPESAPAQENPKETVDVPAEPAIETLIPTENAPELTEPEQPPTAAPLAADLTFVLAARKQKHPPIIACDYIYNYHRTIPVSKNQVYRCISRHQNGPSMEIVCRGELIISNERDDVRSHVPHSHPPDRDLSQLLMNGHIVRSRLYDFVKRSPLSTWKAYHEFRKKKLPDEHLIEFLPEWKDVKRTLTSLRISKLDLNRKNVEHAQIPIEHPPETVTVSAVDMPTANAVPQTAVPPVPAASSVPSDSAERPTFSLFPTSQTDVPAPNSFYSINGAAADDFSDIVHDSSISGILDDFLPFPELMQPETASRASSLSSIAEIYRQLSETAVSPEYSSVLTNNQNVLRSLISPVYSNISGDCERCAARDRVQVTHALTGLDDVVGDVASGDVIRQQMVDAGTGTEPIERLPLSPVPFQPENVFPVLMTVPMVCREVEDVGKLVLGLDAMMPTASPIDRAVAMQCVTVLAGRMQAFLDKNNPKLSEAAPDIRSPVYEYFVDFDMDG